MSIKQSISKYSYKQTEIGEIPEAWKVDNLGSIAVFQNGRSSPDRDTQSDYPVYGANGIIGYTNQINANAGTVVVGRVGAYCGSLYYSQNPSWVTDNAIKGTPKTNIDPKYLFYLLGTLNLNSRSGGSGQPLVNQEILNSISIAVPPYSEQQQIASILSSLDDKIELNRKINKTLEEIGKALFKRWFVDFEFPNDDGKPYKSSGGKMVDSELGEIPKDWEVKRLSDFGKIVCGKTPPKSETSFFDGVTPFIKIPDMRGNTFIVNTEDALSEKGRNYQENKTLPKYSLCVSCIATVGLVSITSQESQTNQQINSIIPNDLKYLTFLYYQLKSMERKLIDYASGGSATPNLNTGDFAGLSIVFPQNEILNSFFTVVWPLFEQILNNYLENSSLEQMRDSLLPRLMTGKLRVN